MIFGCLGVRAQGSGFLEIKTPIDPRRARMKGSWTLYHSTLGVRVFEDLYEE